MYGQKVSCYGFILQVYQNELEEEYDFSDFVDTFPLFRGKGSRVLEEDSNQEAGYLKVSIAMRGSMDHCKH